MSSNNSDKIWKDERFSHLVNNPRFKQLPKSQQKVKIDGRFKSMFENDKFKIKYTVDKYGRKVNKTSTEDLKKYYDLSSDDDEKEKEAEIRHMNEEHKEPENEDSDKADNNEEDDLGNTIIKTDNSLPETIKDKLKDLKVDYLRGEGVLLSDSSSDEEDTDDDENGELFIEHVWGAMDHNTERTEESSRRLAACNMDWDRIRAVDIMVLCNSFIPSGSGTILSVKIYPSEFGKQRLAEEELQGPQELTDKKVDDDTQIDEEDEVYKEKLRDYQLNRLKYYYAVIEFDSVECADIVYKECDGIEYESTANRLDLRFIPDDMEFEDEPKDICEELPPLEKYEPRIFATTALQQAKVELTWDETDVSRTEITQKLFSDKRQNIADNELRKFVAVSSEDEEVEEEDENDGESENEDILKSSENNGKNKINLYKSLLADIQQKEEDKKNKQVEMEFTWGIGDDKKNASKDISEEEENSDNSDDDKDINGNKKDNLTPFEKLLAKKQAKKKAKKLARKEKIRISKDGSPEESDEDEYSSDDFDIDMNDPYFAEEFANGEFKKPKKNTKTKKNKQEKDDESEEKLKAQKELELLLDDGKDEKAHFSLKKIQENESINLSKRKKRQLKQKKVTENQSEVPSDNFTLNIKDERFAAVFNKPEFNIDPTDSSFKKTKGMDILIHEKLKRKYDNGTFNEDPVDKKSKKSSEDVTINMLVKNIKRKVSNNK